MNDFARNMSAIIHRLLSDPVVLPGFRRQFLPQDRGLHVTSRNLNAAFLLALSGARLSHPARGYLSSMLLDDKYRDVALFYLDAIERIEEEFLHPDGDLAAAAHDLTDYLRKFPDMNSTEAVEKYWSLFYPEGMSLLREPRAEAVREIRERRAVSIREPNASPVDNPSAQVLFTSNLLLTVPLDENLESLPLSETTRKLLEKVAGEKQAYWYDHPVPVGVQTRHNEAVYGLRGLDGAVRFEVSRGNAPPRARLPVLLSISTTHQGLQDLAREYLSDELRRAGGLDHLDVFAVAERDVRQLLETVLVPAAVHFFPGRDTEPLSEVLGVDGEYGRHYSFLKAVAALWQVLVDRKVLATFKFDLDQVFPQEELVSETGRSAFEHLTDPLWGSVGEDSTGYSVEMGMLAGALVNEKDIGDGLFTPDVKWPEERIALHQRVFASTWPQAASTEAEMMARYGDGGADGVGSCYQRVHVTGGTTGILIDFLRRHRPFTPSWIGRAEDQAYLLSVLFPDEGPALRYVHAAGLFMRHDKGAFAGEAVRAARIGKMVGDYVRILAFTSYARAMPWEVPSVKRELDPFTGSFISRMPVTVSCLRMALEAAAMFSQGSGSGLKDGDELVRVGTARLGDAIRAFGDEKSVRSRYLREKEGWDLYYDLLDAMEEGLARRDPFAVSMREKTRELTGHWSVVTGDGSGV